MKTVAQLIDAARMDAARDIMHRGFAKLEVNGHTIACVVETVDSRMGGRIRHSRVRWKLDGATVSHRALAEAMAEMAS